MGFPRGRAPWAGGMGRAAPCVMRHLSAGFPGGRAGRHCGAGASAPETRGGRGAEVRAAREREGGSLAAEVPRRVGSTEGEEPAAAPPCSGDRRYAMDSANEPSLLMWCLSRALPALTTIMSMPSKRTGTSPSGV